MPRVVEFTHLGGHFTFLGKGGVRMPRSHPTDPAVLRQQLLERARAGRTPVALAQELEPTAPTIRNSVACVN